MIRDILDLGYGFDTWLREELRKRNLTERDFSQLVVDELGGPERHTQLLIDRVNAFSTASVTSHADLLKQLGRMSNEEIKAILGTHDNPADFLLAYHYYLARDAYHSMFANFRRAVARPEHFLASLLDCLELDFNTRLYVYTKPIGTCKGLIFELEGGVSPDHRMGILLTPLAFESATVFFQTLFHELSHRLHFAREGCAPDRIESELTAYVQDKHLLRLFLADADITWLAPAFEVDLFRLAQRFRDEDPTFFARTAIRFAADAERIRPQFLERFAGQTGSLTAGRVGRICGNAGWAGEVPRAYQSILDFLWLYSTQLCTKHRLAGDTDLWKTYATCFVFLILFSEDYERKYHPRPGNLAYGPVSIVHADGTWDDGEGRQVLDHCGFLKNMHQEERHAAERVEERP